MPLGDQMAGITGIGDVEDVFALRVAARCSGSQDAAPHVGIEAREQRPLHLRWLRSSQGVTAVLVAARSHALSQRRTGQRVVRRTGWLAPPARRSSRTG